MTWCGLVYASGTITGNGNSGWINLESVMGRPDTTGQPAFRAATLRLVPANLATDETLDLDLNVAWDSAGASDLKLHDFTQVTSTNAAETLILPGGDSEAVTFTDVGTANVTGTPTNAYQPSHSYGLLIPSYWKFTWTLAGTTKSMQFTVYATVIS